MNWVNETVAEWGRQLGLQDWGLGHHGVAQLELASGGLLAVELVGMGEEAEVLVYLGHPMGFDGPRLIRQALRRVHHSNAGALSVQVACQEVDGQPRLLTLTRMPARGFTLQTLEHAVDYLTRWWDGARA
jgi:type III secretion system chaperone SycN